MDYKAIADADPGGTLESAFAVLSAATVETRPEVRLAYISIANRVGFNQASELEAAIRNAEAAGQLPRWVDAAMNGEGVDINNPQTETLLRSLVSQQTADEIMAAGAVVVPQFPGLRMGHIKTARDKRASGEV